MNEPKVIQTIQNKDIPADVKERAIEEARYVVREKIANYDVGTTKIWNFIAWSRTPSGHDFWHQIDDAPNLPPKTDWLTTAYIAKEAAKGLIPAIEVSIESWKQRVNAGEEELRRALDEKLITCTFAYCGLCQYSLMQKPSECENCPIYSPKADECCREFDEVSRAIKDWHKGNGPYSDLKDAMQAMLARLITEKDKAIVEQARTTAEQAEKKCKPELRHWDYGLTDVDDYDAPNRKRIFINQGKGMQSIRSDGSKGDASPCHISNYSGYTILGNLDDDLEALQKDVSEFKINCDCSLACGNSLIATIDGGQIRLEIKEGDKTGILVDLKSPFILKLRQLVATAERQGKET
ncbi:hypothetical protein LCGC14_1127250 [marine sediment metagenome]|uniref:Uncharacterized protein n=1 Tax=marine sediment metagenome TaxID=412755 RepID=A0A0F9PKB7_9ZZZZ